MIIYRAKNILNGKCYIGKHSGDLEPYIKVHINAALKESDKGKIISKTLWNNWSICHG